MIQQSLLDVDPASIHLTPLFAGPVCAVPGCGRPVRNRGYCSTHYSRLRRHGDPLICKQIMGDDMARFWSYVDRGESDDCWHWKGQIRENGYGRFNLAGRMVYAHRAAYKLLVGPIPDGLVLDHACHTREVSTCKPPCPHRACVNPAHLEPVTTLVNNRRGANAAKTHCKHGHPFDEENTYRWGTKRMCRTCQALLKSQRPSRKTNAA